MPLAIGDSKVLDHHQKGLLSIHLDKNNLQPLGTPAEASNSRRRMIRIFLGHDLFVGSALALAVKCANLFETTFLIRSNYHVIGRIEELGKIGVETVTSGKKLSRVLKGHGSKGISYLQRQLTWLLL